MPTLTTRLAIVRHAWAEEISSTGDDFSRALTRKGCRRFARLVEKLRRGGLAIDVVATSPLVRAVQTAELLAEGLGGAARIEVVDALAPGSDWQASIDWTIGQDAARVAWVGHAPCVGRLVALSIGDGSAAIRMPKGAVASIRLDDGPGQPGELEWLATAELFDE
ncbi:MAG: SixA phosphatase family protein [Planctomycetaceae bacterium]